MQVPENAARGTGGNKRRLGPGPRSDLRRLRVAQARGRKAREPPRSACGLEASYRDYVSVFGWSGESAG